MADGVSGATSPEDAAAARAAEQARIRKERREAKIKAGGSARLNKITGLGGGIPRDPPPQPATTTAAEVSDYDGATPSKKPQAAAADAGGAATTSPSKSEQHHADPAEVDISKHYYAPRATPRRPASSTSAADSPDPMAPMTEAQIRQLMLGLDPRTSSPAPAPRGGIDTTDDLMMKLMSQIMGTQGGGGGPGGPNPFAGAGGFPGMAMGGPQQQQQQQQQGAPQIDTYAVVWRILHLVVALGLGLYIALFSSFTGTRESRERAAQAAAEGFADPDGEEARRHLFFWGFATAEAVLLTSRFFLDRSRAPPSGLIWTVAGFLPPNVRSYVENVMRYGQIFSTVRSDLLVCVFILGVSAWLRAM